MTYRLLASRTFDKSLKRLSSDAAQYIEQALFDLATEPRKGKPLRQSLKDMYSLHLGFQGTQYRVVYSINDQKHEVHFHYAGSRENFYKEVERLLLTR